jgi:KaiC/GvpD/RAD55 family RecA-like ATPase
VHKENNGDPELIRQAADTKINELDTTKAKIIDLINSSNSDENVKEGQLSNANELHEKGVNNIRKIANDAMD